MNDRARWRLRGALLGSLPGCLISLMSLIVAGCQSASSVESPLSGTVTDPSAQRLHEICEKLLLYYAQDLSLPQSLEALRGIGSGDLPPLVSPESGQAYVYHKTPLEVPGRSGRLLLHDPATAQATVRGEPGKWVVLVTEPEPGEPLATQVILISERELGAILSARDRR